MRARRHIALTGPPAAGKTEVAAMLEAAGYRSVDVGGVLEQRLRGSGIEAMLTGDGTGYGEVYRMTVGPLSVVKVLVRTEDEERAREVILAADTAELEGGGIEEDDL